MNEGQLAREALMGFLMTFQTYIVPTDHTHPTALSSLTSAELSSSFQLVSLLPLCVCVCTRVHVCMHMLCIYVKPYMYATVCMYLYICTLHFVYVHPNTFY